MKSWFWLLALLLIACTAAFGWHALASDPGYVLIKFGATSVETSLIFALLVLLLIWGVVGGLWKFVRWPLTAWSQRTHRRGRERIANGLVALAEGRYQHALRELERASHRSELQAPALLAAARAAHARGDVERTATLLTRAAEVSAPAALALRARFLIEQGKPEAALVLLKAPAQVGVLAPASWRLLVETALLTGDHATALDALAPLARSQVLTPLAFDALQARVLAASLAGAENTDRLNALWSGLSRSQRRMPEALAAYARRAAELGLALAGISEIESALRAQWSERVITTYGELGPAEADTRLRHAESWLAAQPNSPGLLLTLGRLCIQNNLWGKARDYLERGLAILPCALLWQALGECCSGQGDDAAAAFAYANALRMLRGAPTLALPAASSGALNTRASVIEERDQHGVPRLSLPAQ